ncbi:MAG: YigZ family protein [Patescibacteria group bacterium]
MFIFENIIEDKGSKYSVSGLEVKSVEEVNEFLKKLKQNKKYRKATHNTFAYRIKKDNKIIEVKNDDGESGAGNIVLEILRNNNVENLIICVTRWFGGKKLGGDRFRHVKDATIYFLEKYK